MTTKQNETDTLEGKFMQSILDAFEQFYKSAVSRKIKMGIARSKIAKKVRSTILAIGKE